MAVALASGPSSRFLIYFSYLGHEFRGMQKQNPVFVNEKWTEIPTVQNTLEESLKFVFKPYHDVHVKTSSRTDSGVHGLRSSVHVDLHMNYQLNPDKISSGLNGHFTRRNMGLRVISTYSVPNWFSARHHAISRTYLYRFAFRKQPRLNSEKHLAEIPFSEHGRTLFLQNSAYDIPKMQEAAALLEGTKNFLCFMSRSAKRPYVNTNRSIYSLKIRPGKPFMREYDEHADLFHYWDILCHGQSFLYKQVRRIVGVLLAVGRGTVDLDTVQRMIDHPVAESWDNRAICVPPWGLYLLDVAYNPLYFHTFDEPDSDDQRATYALSY